MHEQFGGLSGGLNDLRVLQQQQLDALRGFPAAITDLMRQQQQQQQPPPPPPAAPAPAAAAPGQEQTLSVRERFLKSDYKAQFIYDNDPHFVEGLLFSPVIFPF
jgi:hypothetical protein